MTEPIRQLSGIAVAIIEDNINTDQIAPVGNVTTFKQDYADLLFHNRRYHDDGTHNPDFVLNKPAFQHPKFLVTGANFGCGSSREHAVWAIKAVGIRCVIAPSIALFFRENCLQNGVLPICLPDPEMAEVAQSATTAAGETDFEVDLEAKTLALPNGRTLTVDIPDAERLRLLEGLDDIGLTLKYTDDIAAWETRTREAFPWLQTIPNRNA